MLCVCLCGLFHPFDIRTTGAKDHVFYFIQPQVHHLVGVAVTPVVCFLGEIGESKLNLNSDEVSECFSVPLELFLDRERCVLSDFS